MATEIESATDLDHEGAVIWVECPMCGADRGIACTAIQLLGIVFEPGKIHEMRLEKWMKLKAEAYSWCRYLRHPNFQQIPRTKGDL